MLGYIYLKQPMQGTYARRWVKQGDAVPCMGFTVQNHPYFEVPAILRPRKVVINDDLCDIFWLVSNTVH